MILIKYHLVELITRTGRNPFRTWLETLPVSTAARIQARLYRAELGNLGDYKAVGAGVFEFRVHVGPGYRVYFGRRGTLSLVIISGGSKSTQNRDIVRAKSYWRQYTEDSHDKTKR